MKQANLNATAGEASKYLNNGSCPPRCHLRHQHRLEVRRHQVKADPRLENPLAHDAMKVLSVRHQFNVTCWSRANR